MVPFVLPVQTRLRGTPASAVFDEDGGLWLLGMDAVFRVDTDGDVVSIDTRDLAGERLRMFAGMSSEGPLVITDAGLWRLRQDARPVLLYASKVIANADEPEPGRILILLNPADTNQPEVMELRNGGRRDVIRTGVAPVGRAIGLRDRGGTLFVAMDRYLLVVSPDGSVEALGWDEGVESGGPLLVDREGSLRLGSFVGLQQYPEPETRLWAERQGVPSRHTRFLARTGDAVWVMTWAGPAYMRQTAAGRAMSRPSWDSRTGICMDDAGDAWTSTAGAVVQLRGASARMWPLDRPAGMHGCTPSRDGGVWIGTTGGLLHVDRERRVIRRTPPPPAAPDHSGTVGLPGASVSALLHDSQDHVWVAAGASVCHAPAASLASDTADGRWLCTSPLTSGVATGMLELPGGRIWLSSNQQGLFALHGDEWRPQMLPGAPTRTIHTLSASPRGGMWIAGAGILVRVTDRPDGTLEVLERPGPFHGLPVAGGSAVLDDADGTLWIATNRGVFQVPAAARFANVGVPAAALVDARVDDVPVPLDQPLVLRHDRNPIELNFAALSFRDRSRLQHEVRLAPDQPWVRSAGEPSFRWVDLRPGEYQVEYRVSTDGVHWSGEPTRFAFVVRPAWYATTWFLLVAGGFAVLLVWLGYRARLAYLIGLERQRTRIAMDLHDEVGSGLASVGIMAGVLATDGVNTAVRSRTASEIAAAAEDLGNSLSDIVWSLDARTATMQELAARLAEHGERLCAAECTRFTPRFPAAWPVDRPSVAVRRNVLLIGLEALHNAVRHGGARNVTLSLLPAGRRDWELIVSDDGAGLRPVPEPANGRGRGLPGMRRRAAEIGAQLTIVGARPTGTVVALRFSSQPLSLAHRMIMRVRGPR